jgi:hypothetical protein
MMKMLQAYQAKTDADLPVMKVTETSQKELPPLLNPKKKVKTMACQGMEARQEEKPTSMDRKLEAAQQEEVPVEDAEVIPVGEPKKESVGTEYWPRSTAARNQKLRHGRIAVARRGTSRRAKVARKTPIDRKMSRRATVARGKRDIVNSYFPQEKCHSRRGLVASRTRTTHRAKVARRKVNSVGRDRTRDKAIIGT